MYIFIAPAPHKTGSKKWYIKIAARKNKDRQNYRKMNRLEGSRYFMNA